MKWKAMLMFCCVMSQGCVRGVTAAKCCLTTCVIVEEERCDAIIKLTAQKMGTPVYRANEDGSKRQPDTQTHEATLNDEQVRNIVNNGPKRINELQTTITGILDTFQEFSDDLETSLHGDRVVDVMEVQQMLARINAAYDKVRLTINQQQMIDCPKAGSSATYPTSAATKKKISTPDVSSSQDIAAPDASSTPDITTPVTSSTPHIATPDVSSTPDITTPDVSSAPDTATPDAFSTPDIVTPDPSSTPYIVTPDPSFTPDIATPDTTSTLDIKTPDASSHPDIATSDASTTSDASAKCTDGYSGTNCEQNIDDCLTDPCQTGETCHDEVNSYRCSCDAGYTGTSCEQEALCEMGMKNGDIADSQINASSTWMNKANHRPYHGRLDELRSDTSIGGWDAAKSQVGEWIQVDLRNPKSVAGIVTQGREGGNSQWVTSYKVACGNSTDSLQIFSEDGAEKVFPGNSDRNTKVFNKLPNVMTCRFVRIYPQTWHEHINMRMELLKGECFRLF